MATTNDITDVVKGIVKTYIKPKYEIYRIHYILSILRYDCLEAQYRTHLVEVTDKMQIFNNETTPTVTKDFIEQWKNLNKEGKACLTVEGITPEHISGGYLCNEQCEVIATIIKLNKVC